MPGGALIPPKPLPPGVADRRNRDFVAALDAMLSGFRVPALVVQDPMTVAAALLPAMAVDRAMKDRTWALSSAATWALSSAAFVYPARLARAIQAWFAPNLPTRLFLGVEWRDNPIGRGLKLVGSIYRFGKEFEIFVPNETVREFH